MDKHSKRSASIFRYPVLIAFTLFFAGLFLLDLVTPDRAYSELENTTLSQRPSLSSVSADGLNKFFTAYTKYVKDQVAGRDNWVALQSTVETKVMQKEQNGGILLGKQQMMFPAPTASFPARRAPCPRTPPRWKRSVSGTRQGQRDAGACGVRYLPGKRPCGGSAAGRGPLSRLAFRCRTGAGGALWTCGRPCHRPQRRIYLLPHRPPLDDAGAYYAYQQFCETLGLTPFDRDAHTAETCEDFYGTHYSKTRTWNAEPDTITWYDLQNSLTIWNVTGPGQPTEGTTTGLYDLDKLKVYDKYAMFLHGNNGLSRIEGDGIGRILVIKDSYANCFVPYLTANYADIDVVDFRNYNYGLDKLIADNDYDQLLVLYSFDSFKSDPYLYRAGVAG